MITETIKIRHDLPSKPVQIRHVSTIDGVQYDNVFQEDNHDSVSIETFLAFLVVSRAKSVVFFQDVGATNITIQLA